MKSNPINLDKTGIICSSLCAAHCLLTPLVVFLSPAIALILKNEWIHIALLLFIFPNALYVFIKSRKAHKSNIPLNYGLTGLLLLLAAFLCEQLEIGYKFTYLESILTITGSTSLAGAHLLNLKKLS